MSSIRDKMSNTIRGRSASPHPNPNNSNTATTCDANTNSQQEGSMSSSMVDALSPSLHSTTSTNTHDHTNNEQQQLSKDELIQKLTSQNNQLKSKIQSHELKLKEGMEIITALENEKNFDKQQILDLKNQHFKLQKDLDDSHFDKTEEVQVLKKRIEEGEKEREVLKKKLDDMKNTINNNDNNTGINNLMEMNTMIQEHQVVSSPQSVKSDTSEVRQTWRQLEEKKEQLESSLSLLHETQSTLATLEHKYKALQKQFDDRLNSATIEIKTRLQSEIDELKSALRSKDESIANLHERLEEYNEDLTKAEDEVDRLHKEIEEKNDYDEIKRLLEDEKQLTSELTEKYHGLTSTVEKLQKETNELKVHSVDQLIKEKENQIESLHNEVNVYRKKMEEEKKQSEMLLNIKASRIKELEEEVRKAAATPETRLNQLEAKNKSLNQALETLERELHNAIEAQREMEQEMREKLEEKDRLLFQSLTDEDFDVDFTQSNNSIGVVNETVVSKLKSKMSDLEKEHVAEKKKLNDKITKNLAKISELQNEIDKHRRDVSSMEKSQRDKYSALKKEVDEHKTSVDRLKSELAEKQREVWTLEKDIARYKASTEQKELDLRDDLESQEKKWIAEKRQLLDDQKVLENKLKEALKREEIWNSEKRKLLNERKDNTRFDSSKDTISRKEHVQKIKMQEDEWKTEKEQLMQESKVLRNKLNEALKRSASLKRQIDELEKNNVYGEKRLSTYKKDITVINELKNKLATQESELNDVKQQLKLQKSNYQTLQASMKKDGRKRSDTLKVIQLNEEVDRLRSELRRAKWSDGDENSEGLQEVKKKVYDLAKAPQHNKEMTNQEETLRNEIRELKNKLSDRDITIAANLRTSILNDNKIKSLTDELQTLHERLSTENHPGYETPQDIPIVRPDPTCASSLASQNAEQEVQMLRKTQKSLSHQVLTLERELAEVKERREEDKSLGTITQLRKQVEEYKTKISERDVAIQSLVKSSITQEQQIAALREEVTDLKGSRSNDNDSDLKVNKKHGPTWQEVERLQQEGEIFAGQIIEQDEEIENLRTLLNDAYVKSDENEKLKSMIEDLREQLEMNEDGTEINVIKLELEDEQKKRQELQIEVDNLQEILGRSDQKRFSKIQGELEEVEETNQKLQFEIRDLRRKLRTAQLDAERTEELETELMKTKNVLNELKKSKRLRASDHNSLKGIVLGREDLETEELQWKKNMQKLEDELRKTEEACKNLEQELATCREEKEKLQEEYSRKELVLNQEKVVLRSELNLAIKAREEIEVKLKASEDNEITLRGHIESHKTLKELAINDKDRELALYQERIKTLQRDFDDQNDVIASLTEEVKQLRSNHIYRADAESTEIIAALSEEVKKLRNQQAAKQADDESTQIIAALTDEIKKLRNNQSQKDSDDVIAALSEEVKTLHAALREAQGHGHNDPAEMEKVIRNEIDQEIQSIKIQKDFLANENMKLQQKLDSVENGNEIKSLRRQVEEAEKSRTLFEKTMISTYERKLNLMQMNKDLTIDGLRKDLAQKKESSKEVETDLLEKIRSLETERHELEAELKAKMQHKNAKITFLEQTLAAHEQVVKHMQDEMDQLQSGMEDVSVTRRAEHEELQEELMSVQSRATKYEREIAALKMKIDDMRIQHKNELERMQFHMEEMQMYSDENPTIRQLAEKDKMAVNNLSKQVDSLREKVRGLQEENFDLRKRIDRDDSRASKNDKWRNSALQEQVQMLTKRIKELEGGDELSTRSSTSRISSGRRIPLNPRGTGMSNKSSMGDDISTYTEATM